MAVRVLLYLEKKQHCQGVDHLSQLWLPQTAHMNHVLDILRVPTDYQGRTVIYLKII